MNASPPAPNATPRRLAAVRKADIERAVKGAQAAGLRVCRIEFEGARFAIITDEAGPSESNPLDDYRRRKNGPR